MKRRGAEVTCADRKRQRVALSQADKAAKQPDDFRALIDQRYQLFDLLGRIFDSICLFFGLQCCVGNAINQPAGTDLVVDQLKRIDRMRFDVFERLLNPLGQSDVL